MSEVGEVAQLVKISFDFLEKTVTVGYKIAAKMTAFIKWLWMHSGNRAAISKLYSRPGTRRVLRVGDDNLEDVTKRLEKIPGVDFVVIPDKNKEDGFKHIIVHENDIPLINDVFKGTDFEHMINHVFDNEMDFLEACPEHQKDIDDFLKKTADLPVEELSYVVKDLNKVSSKEEVRAALQEKLKHRFSSIPDDIFNDTLNIASKSNLISIDSEGNISVPKNFNKNLTDFKESINVMKEDTKKINKVKFENDSNYEKITLNKGEINSLLREKNVEVLGKSHNEYFIPNTNKKEFVRIPEDKVFPMGNDKTDEAFIQKDETYNIFSDTNEFRRSVKGEDLLKHFEKKEKKKEKAAYKEKSLDTDKRR